MGLGVVVSRRSASLFILLKDNGQSNNMKLAIVCVIIRLNLVKSAISQKRFFWCFFIRNYLSMVDLILKVVLEFLSDLPKNTFLK